MDQLIGQWAELGWTALKTLLLFITALVGIRFSERRLLAEFNAFDLVVVVGVGAIIGRTATATDASFSTGAVALIALLLAHRVVSVLHRRGWLAGLLDRRPLILLARGQLRPEALRAAGLTEHDVYRLLRQAGEGDLDALRYVLYEDRGSITTVRSDQTRGEAVRAGLAEAGADDPD